MKRFLFISCIICALAFFLAGCGQSSSDGPNPEKKPAPDKATETVVEPAAPAVEKTGTEKATEPDTTEMEETSEVVAEAPKKIAESAAVTEASSVVADVIEMKNTTAFAAHTRGIVMFEHEKHTAPPPTGYGITCGECHHDKNGTPLDLKPGDAVQNCMACHHKTERPKKPADVSRDDWNAMQLEYYYGAIHANCIDCHREAGAGPVKCTECHPAPKR